jgi:hypothetical protein
MTVEELHKLKIIRWFPNSVPRSKVLFGNAFFDALHQTSYTLHRVDTGIP